VAGDDACGLLRPEQGAVDYAREPRISQPVTERRRLSPSEGAEAKAIEVAVEQAMRVFDLGVPDEVDAGQF
jgi:hypothetical protein